MVDSYDMDFIKGIVILVKVDKIYNILKSASHYLFVERWVWYWSIDDTADKEFDIGV